MTCFHEDGPPLRIPLNALGPFWNEDRQFSRWEAWLDIAIRAEAGGGLVRGSLAQWAKRWKWPRNRVRRHLDRLIATRRIERVAEGVLRPLPEHEWLEEEKTSPRAPGSGRRQSPTAKSPRSISDGVRFRVLRRCGFKCVYCGRPAGVVELQVDHVRAVADGGSGDESNLAAACATCNRGKGARGLLA